MRILALVTDAFGGRGGIAQYNRDFLTAYAQLLGDAAARASGGDGRREGTAGEQPRIVVLPRAAPEPMEALPPGVDQRPPIRGRVLYSLRAVWTALREGSFDVVFCGHLFMAPLAAVLGKLFSARLWLQLYGIDAWQRPSLLRYWAAERADLVTAISRYTRSKFLSWTCMQPESVRVLSCAVRGRFTPGQKPDYLLRRYDLEGRKVLLTVGRVSAAERHKGHDRVIAALPDLLTRHPNLAYVIVGEGDGLPRLEVLARQHGVDHAVRFIGKVSDEELPDVYRLADVFVMPGNGEGFGIAYLEAMASGLPVVGSEADGSRDALRDGMLGPLADPDDLNSIQSAIEQCLALKPWDKAAGVEVFAHDRFTTHIHALLQKVFVG